MESKVLGIPLVIWFLLLGLIFFVDVPMLLLHNQTLRRLSMPPVTQKEVVVTATPSPEVSPEATPSAAAPSAMMFKKVVLPTQIPAVTR